MARTNNRAAYFIHGRGRGHASRANVVYPLLVKRGFDVTVFAGGDAESHLVDAGIPFVNRAPLLPSATAVLELALRTRKDFVEFKSHAPILVVSDGDHSALLAARAHGIQSVAIGHDMTFDSSVQLPDLPRLPLTAQRINSLPTKAATRRIAVHFLPAESHHPHLHLARPDAQAFAASDNNGSIVCYFRDNNGARIARQLSERGHQVLWFTSQQLVVPGVTVLPTSVTDFRSALQSCLAVVTSAGSNVLAECIAQHKPVLALHHRRDTEQQLNALLIEHARVGVGATFDNTNARLPEFLDRIALGDFARVDIHSRMRPLSTVLTQVLDDLHTPTPA